MGLGKKRDAAASGDGLLRVGIIGAGRVGSTVGYILGEKGYRLCGVCNRSVASTKRAARDLGTRAFDNPVQLAAESTLVLLTTPDDHIEGVCRRIAREGGFRPGQVVVHMSGALGSDCLDTAAREGAYPVSIHPLQTFVSFEKRNDLGGVFCAVEGHPRALPVARRLVRDLGGRFVEIDPKAKVLYHAAAVVACNYLVGVLDFATELFAATGVDRDEALKALLPLVKGTVDNLERVGIPAALSGPLARGDVETVKAHLSEIQAYEARAGNDFQWSLVYRTLGRKTLAVARARGLDREAAERLENLLGTTGPDGCREDEERTKGEERTMRREEGNGRQKNDPGFPAQEVGRQEDYHADGL